MNNSGSEQLKKIFGYIEEMNAEAEAWKKMFDMQTKLITSLELDKIKLEKEIEELKNKAERYRQDANKKMAKRMHWEKDNKLPKPYEF